MEADLSDPEINTAYLDVRSASDTNWLLLDYVSPTSDALRVSKTGTGGLPELQEALEDGTASYAYVRVKFANDKQSEREKFILVVWIGPSCKIMRRGKVSVHSANVKRAMPIYSMDVSARERDDLAEGPIVIRLRKAGGASYDGV